MAEQTLCIGQMKIPLKSGLIQRYLKLGLLRIGQNEILYSRVFQNIIGSMPFKNIEHKCRF